MASYKATVTRIELGFSNNTRIPYAIGHLDCGHPVDVPLLPELIECRKCGMTTTRMESSPEEKSRGGYAGVHCTRCAEPLSGRIHFTPDPHNPDHQRLRVDDSLECKRCEKTARELVALIAFCKTPEFSHLVERDLTAGGTGAWMSFLAYRRDSESPTSCRLECGVEVTDATREALRNAGLTHHYGPTRGQIAESGRVQ